MAAISTSSAKLAPTFKFDSAHHVLPDATRRILNEIEQQFYLSEERLLAITRQFVEDFSLGLGEYNKAMAMMCVSSDLSPPVEMNCAQRPMLNLPYDSPTFVTGVPDGTEKGFVPSSHITASPSSDELIAYDPVVNPTSTFLALDLGGTNLWVLP